VLLSAGIGITPMISALNHVRRVQPGRAVIFGHATRNPGSYAHRADVEAALAAMPDLQVSTFYECLDCACDEPGAAAGFMTVELLPAWSYADTDVYLCGPVGFMQAQWRRLLELGAPPSRLHREVFGPELLNHLQ
jgi:nitric oxide dioxygenase